jgi:zinc transporter ZupT
MKRSAVFLACSIALTLLFYLLADVFLPPPPPSAPVMLLFAGIAMVLVWVVQMCVHCLRSGKQNTHTAKLLLAGALGTGMLGTLLLGMLG